MSNSLLSSLSVLINVGLIMMPSVHAEEIKNLEEITVISENEDSSYKTSKSATISRSQLSVDEMPRSVQVFNRKLIDDIQATSIEEIVSYSPNLVYVGTGDGRDNEFSIRGFEFKTLITDGFKFRESISNPEVFNMEQLEVLKGADSLLYGANSPGGLISMTSKRPQRQDQGEIIFETNRYGAINPKLDIGGTLNDEETVRYRLIGVYDDDPGWRDFTHHNKRKFIAPSASIDLTEKATLTMFAEYTDDKRQNDMGTAIDANGQAVAPLEWVNTHPDDQFVTDQLIVGFDVEYAFNNNWSANIRARYLDGGFDYGNLWLPSNYSAPNYTRFVANQSAEYDEKTIQFNLLGDFETGGIRHRVSTGIDISNAFTDYDGCFDPTAPSLLNFSTTPVYPAQPGDACDTSLYPNSFVYTGDGDYVKRRGIFIQDAISLTDHLLINLGLRYEDHSQTSDGGSYSAAVDDSVLLPQIGLIYSITDQHAIYLNYSESFTPATQRDSQGALLDSEEGKGYEIGFKSYFMHEALKLNLAYFDIKKDNVALADPINPFASLSSGKQKSHGVEIDLIGRVLPKLDLIASYGYLKTEDQGSNPGKELINAPRHTVSLWANYDIAPKWTLGAGIRHVASRYATYDNTAKLESFTLLNAGVTYAHNAKWRMRLNLNNITDEEYIESAQGGLARLVYPGEPFNATASVSYSF